MASASSATQVVVMTSAPPGIGRRSRPSLISGADTSREVAHLVKLAGQAASANDAAKGQYVSVDMDPPPPPGPPPPLASMGKGSKTKGYVPSYKQNKYRLSSATSGPAEPSPYRAFMDKQVRAGFVRKVFGIFAAQIVFTIAAAFTCVSISSVATFIQNTPAVFWSAWIISLVTLVSLVCCDDIRRRYPVNYIVLGVFTLTQSYLISVVSSFFDTTVLLAAFGATAVVSLSLMLFACQTKIDFTKTTGFLLAAVVLLLFFGLMAVSIPGSSAVMAYGCIGALLFSVFIIYDVQAVLGGTHRKYQLGPEEYVFAAVNLYLDVINLFIFMLVIVAGKTMKSA